MVSFFLVGEKAHLMSGNVSVSLRIYDPMEKLLLMDIT